MPTESLTIRPPADTWPGLLRRNASDEATSLRRELGLPTDRPIIMTGHQAEFWHPGILAKYLAADAAASRLHAAVAWLIVDQDRADSVKVRYPVTRDGARVEVGESIVRERPAASPTSLWSPSPPPSPSAARDSAAGLAHIAGALERHANLHPIARRIAAALEDLIRPLIASTPATIFATDLHKLGLFRRLVDRMMREPEACARAYNAAALRHPAARIRPLIADEVQDRWELPLWHLPPGKPRTHVYAEDLPGLPVHELAPKALLMTGLLRMAACDLFIHGTGGGGADDHEGYDAITDEWLREWLGAAPHAPVATVTATRFLPMDVPAPPTPEAAARSVWLAHSARHNPYIIRDGYFDDAKRRLVLQIAAAPHGERAALYRQMHQILDEYRRTHVTDLTQIEARAAETTARLDSAPVVYDRTWPFPLYPDRVLTGLRDEIRAAFASR